MCKPAESRDLSGAEGCAVCGPRPVDMLEDKSSLFGRGRAEDRAGEPGSFFTLIIGGIPFGRLFCVSLHVSQNSEEGATHEVGELLPFELERSTLGLLSSLGDPLLRARFAAGSWIDAEVGVEAEEGAMAVNWRGDTRSTEGGSVVDGAVATAVDMAKRRRAQAEAAEEVLAGAGAASRVCRRVESCPALACGSNCNEVQRSPPCSGLLDPKAEEGR